MTEQRLLALLDQADALARRAGAVLVEMQGAELGVTRKELNDVVTAADLASERLVIDGLRVLTPEAAILSEEAGFSGSEAAPRWIIDPLDGTTNFLHGIPHFAISIAVEEPLFGGSKREVTTGLVYQPVTDESYWAEKSRGAWRHDQRLRVSSRRDMGDCLIATGIPFMGHGDMAQWTRIFGAVAPSVAGIRRFGAAALDLAHVASGRYDGFWESGLKPWDMAAGLLLVREAGGFTSDFRGGDQMIERKEVIAGNDAIHSKLHKLVAGALR
jgi:myo-inositol-1(or 4)-monophosphatase